MKKSVYSLVLTDEVVREIDRAAYEQNTSRSNMINEILADYVSYITPEKRMREVFRKVERVLTGSSAFQVLLQPSDAMFSLRSALSYKYNPNVRYSVELYKDASPEIGALRVSLRSQNSSLMLYMLQFFKLWCGIERARIGYVECSMDGSRYERKLMLRGEQTQDNEALGSAIADYIALFDACMKQFFDLLNDPSAAVSRTDQRYALYLDTHTIIL